MPKRARIGTEAWPGRVAVPGQVRPELWPSVDADALPDDRRAQFLRRKLGIQLYFDGATEADIRAACGYGRSHIYRLITERCLAQHADGNVNGWRGALPHRRVNEWTRTTPLAGLARTRTGWPVLTTVRSALPQRIDAETSQAYRALTRHLRRHVARGSESFGIEFLLHPNPLQMAAVLRENRSAMAAFAELLFCRAIEPGVLDRRWPWRRPDNHVGGIWIRQVQPRAKALPAVSPEVQAALAQQVASATVTHAWRWAQGVAINAVCTGIADWRGACEPLDGSTGRATGPSVSLPHAPAWAAALGGASLRFVSAAPAASLDWSMPTPDKAARVQRWRRDAAARRATQDAARTGLCLQWSLDLGWQVLEAAHPGAGAVKRHRLLGAGKPDDKFWLFESEGHFVARACAAKVQTLGETPGEAITRLRFALLQFRGRYAAPALPADTASPVDLVPCRTDLQRALDEQVAACLAEFGFWRGAARLHDIACNHLRDRRHGERVAAAPATWVASRGQQA